MSDIATVFNVATASYDWAFDGTDLVTDASLETPVLLSFFCDARAEADAVLPDDAVGPLGTAKTGTGDRRGWWADPITEAARDVQPGDAFPAPADSFGSLFWLLRRRKMTTDLPGDVESYARDALQWMIGAKLASQVTATATVSGLEAITLSGSVTVPSGLGIAFRYPVTIGQS